LYQDFQEEHQRRTAYSLTHYVEDFNVRAQLTLSQPTIRMYNSAFRSLIRICGNKLIKSITPMDIERFKVARRYEVSAVTVNIELRTLRAGFNEAKRLNIIEQNPFEQSKLVRVESKEAAFLTEGDIGRLFLAITDNEFRNTIQFAICTMMRLSELTHLEWSDIDLPHRKIVIRSKADFRVKTGRPRVVPMNDWVFDYLSRKMRKSNYVFGTTQGTPMRPSSLSHRFKRSVRRAGLSEAIHFHSLRHTGVSLLASRGVSLDIIRRIAGHSSSLTTAIYAHYEDSHLTSAIAQLKILNQSGSPSSRHTQVA
jgi:integrase